MKQKILLTGASGFLGYHLLRVLTPDWDVYGIANANTIDYADATIVNCDLRDYISLGNFIDDIEPDAIIHTAAIADANFCQQNPALSYEVNVDASKNLAGICSDFQIPFVYTSTDLVFDGKKGLYTEEDDKNPLSTYGEQKATAEDEILNIYPDALVLRIPIMFGYPGATSGNYLHKLLNQLQAGQQATLFTDEYRSICGAKSISRGIAQLTGKAQGILHLAGPERLSRYDFGKLVVTQYGFDEALIKAMSQKEFASAAPRPADVSLNIKKALHLGFAPQQPDAELRDIVNQNYL